MVVVRGMYEITQLIAGCIGSVGLYMTRCHVIPLRYGPDLPAALFIMSSVIVIHHLRCVNYPPIQRLWKLLLELVVLYIATQLLVGLMWEQFHVLLDIIRETLLRSKLGVAFVDSSPRLIQFMHQDVCYIAQLLLAVLVTIKAVKFTRALDYILPDRRLYQFHESLASDEDFDDEDRESES